jgi:hypothetical protein
MKTIQFLSKFGRDKIEIPRRLRSKLRSGKNYRVIVFLDEDADDEKAWKKMSANEFLKGYSAEDSIYD